MILGRSIRRSYLVIILGMMTLLSNERSLGDAPTVRAATNTVGLGYPRPILYGGLTSAGIPLINGLGEIDATAVANMARFPMVILPPTPLSDMHPELLTALRAANPNLKVYAYTLGHDTFCTPNYAANVYYRKYWEAVEAYDNDTDPFCNPADTATQGGTGDGFLWWQNGSHGGTDVNLARRVSNGAGGWRYDLAEDLGALMANTAVSGGYDGIFIDVFCNNILWQETPSNKYDYQRAGYGTNNADSANRTAFQAGWEAGHAALAAKIRTIIPDANFPVSGNCAQSPSGVRGTMNGWMQENFPNQNGGTWFTNMFGNADAFGGYVADEYTYLAPQENYIFTGLSYNVNQPDEWKNSTQQRRLRFGLASASLGNGFAAYEDYAAHAYTAPYHTWWADEYAVNTVTGESTSGSAHTGWLGTPTSDMYQMITPSLATNLFTNPEFETDTSGWSLASNSGASATLGRVQEGGDYAAQVNITALGSVSYAVNLGTSGTFGITSGLPVTVTFWAKASKPRPANLVLYRPGTEYGNQFFSLTTSWKQYQFTLSPTQTIANAQFRIDLGQDTGTVTVDSLQLQTTSGQNLYRRDFTNGIVLINPNTSAVTMSLEKSYKKILGTVNPTTNDGSVVSSMTLQASDAVFLLNHDVTPPSGVENLNAD